MCAVTTVGLEFRMVYGFQIIARTIQKPNYVSLVRSI